MRDVLLGNQRNTQELKNLTAAGQAQGGIQTIGILQGMTTKLAEARGGELNAATALRKMKLAIERTLLRSEADAINAANANANDEVTRTRRDGEAGW